MALLFLDGFDHYGSGGDALALGKWGSPTSNATASNAVTPRTGPFALRLTATAEATTKGFPASGGCVVGFAFQFVPAWSASDILRVQEGAIVHVALAITATGALSIKRGTTVLATSVTALVPNTWYFLELLTVIHDTAGSYEVRIDGIPEAALLASGVDTRNAGTTGQWDRVRCAPPQVVGYLDDLYLCDTSGPAPRNTFLGPVKVETLYPLTDAVAAGSNAGLTPSTGTDHGALVDEPAPNTTDFNSAATVGLKDTYRFPPVTLPGAILGVQTALYVSKSDAAARQVCAVVRTSGADFDGASVAPLTTFSYLTEVRGTNPATGLDWTASDLASLEAGLKVTA